MLVKINLILIANRIPKSIFFCRCSEFKDNSYSNNIVIIDDNRSIDITNHIKLNRHLIFKNVGLYKTCLKLHINCSK